MDKLYVQYGCGFCAPEGWLNFDSSPTLRFERLPVLGRLYTKNAQRFPANVRYGDIVKGLPVPEGSACGVYCSHMLDYLSYADVQSALANTRKILSSPGTFRLVIQDCRPWLQDYFSDDASDACSTLMERTGWGRKDAASVVDTLKSSLGHPYRLWFWDFKGLAKELESAGFHSIRQAHFGDSEDRKFCEVENVSRWTEAVGIECKG